MKTKRLLVTIFLLALLSVIPVQELFASQPHAPTAAPGWFQINPNGFGNAQNTTVSTLAGFGGQLYAGTINNNGAQLWRRDVSGTWSSLITPGFGVVRNIGIDDLFVFGGQLYASTEADEVNGGEVYRSNNGTTWTPVVTAGFGDRNNGEVFRLTTFNSRLYASTWSYTTTHGAEIYRSSTGNSGDWACVANNGLNNDTHNEVVLSFETVNSYLYAGTRNGTTGGEVWRTINGTNWSQVNTDGFGDANNTSVAALAAFNGYLYASTYHASGAGAQIWRCQVCDNSDWTQVVNNGYGNANTRGMNALEVLNNTLYFVVGNLTTGMEVWRTTNGTTWEQIGVGGFGDSHNIAPYWDNGVTIFNNALYIGTWNNTTGGQVWQRANTLYLPLIIK